MTSRFRAKVSGFLAVVIVIAAAPTLAQTPEGVSPGAVDRIAEVEGRCPTFIWGSVSGATAFELVVYRLTQKPQASNAEVIDLAESEEVLYARVPGGATAWQPELANGLEPGENYVWFVRTSLREDSGEIVVAGEWSEPRFFSIPATPSAIEVEAALEVLRRYTELGSIVAVPLDRPSPEHRSGAPDRSIHAGISDPPTDGLKSVPTATAAIKGSIPDATGETYGVVGLSNSPDGAGVAAANLNGGPDLVLDGAVDGQSDTNIFQDRIERSSGAPATFSFSNTGGGGLVLHVDGAEVVTSATDRDTIGDLSCPSGQLAKWNGAAWVCAPDLDTDTLSSLSCAAWEIPKWNGSAWECFIDWNTLFQLGCTTDQIAKHNGAEWVCTSDEDTIYTFAPGLIIDGGQIRIDPSAFSTQLSVLDSSDFVGPFTSIAIGADGLGLIAYQKDGGLNVAHCNNAACSSATTATLDASPGVGEYSSIAIGADGLGLISYYDNPNTQLKVAHCGDIVCSNATVAILDTVGEVGKWTSIAVGIDGLGIISYFDENNYDLKVAHCNDNACSSARIVTLDDSSSVGTNTSIAIGTDGRAIISYHALSLGDLRIAHCDDILCNSAYIATLDSVGDVGEYTSIAIGADGFPLISYWDMSNNDLKVTHCSHIACFNSFYATLDSGGVVGRHTSIAIGVDGFGIISYYDDTNEALKVAHCVGATCSSATTATIDNDGEVGRWNSIAIGADGLGLISYWDQFNETLKAAHLGIGVP